MTMWLRRRKFAASILPFLFAVLLVLKYSLSLSNKQRLRLRTTTQQGCQLPRPNPFDPTILEFINKPPALQCHGEQHELTYLSEDEWLHINDTAVSNNRLSVVCFYRCYDRIDDDDDNLHYDQWVRFNDTVRPGCEFVETSCERTSFPRISIYRNNHNQILKRESASSRARPGVKSVILIVLDSVSHSSFVRNMPKSLDVLKILYQSYIFDGMNKIGDQSFPNAVAFLAGRDYQTEFGDVKGFFDEHPLIWKDFENAESFLFVLSDHGHRFDSIRRTAIGRIEESLPFFSMHIPMDLRQKFPRIAKTVERNTQILTSFWDFYVTMRDILDLGQSDRWEEFNDHKTAQINTSYSKRGLSLLRPIEDRNCKEAGIPDEFCTCYVETSVDTENALIQQLANKVIDHLNCLLKPFEVCAQLVLSKIIQAEVIANENLVTTNQYYRLTVEAKPSKGIFEALLKYNGTTETFEVSGKLNRVNSYGNQSICVHEQELRKFCYCTNESVRIK